MVREQGILSAMSRWTPSLLCVALVAVAICTGACGTPPTREMNEAESAIDAAHAAGADRYAMEEYQAAVDALTNARTAVEARDYRLALNHALDSRERAQVAARQAGTQQAKLRSTAELQHGEVALLLTQATRRLAEAEAARVSRAALTRADARVTASRSSLQEAGARISDGDYAASQILLTDAATELRAVIAELAAVTASRGARPRR